VPVIALSAFVFAAVVNDPADPADPAPPVVEPAANAHATTHVAYEHALYCGTGAAVGLVAGLLATSYGAGALMDVVLLFATPNTVGAAIVVAAIAYYVVVAAGGVVGAAGGAAALGDSQHTAASAIAGGVGAAVGLGVGAGILASGVLWLGQQNPNTDPVQLIALYLGTVAVAAVSAVGVTGLTAGALAPALASDAQ
jgi:hypothetical protein